MPYLQSSSRPLPHIFVESRSAESLTLYNAGANLVFDGLIDVTVALEPKVQDSAAGRRLTAMQESKSDSSIVEYYIIDAGPPILIAEMPIAFAAKTATTIMFGWAEEIDDVLSPDADEFDRRVVTELSALMQTYIKDHGPEWVYEHWQDTASAGIRAREVKCAPKGTTGELLLQQLHGRKPKLYISAP